MNISQSPIIIVAAPSGTGKTTLTRRLVKENPNLSFSVSLTTRPQRMGEQDGEHYHFVDKETFMRYADDGQLVEWANVFGNLYGTSKEEVSRILTEKKRVLLEIDVQGSKNIRNLYPEVCDVFILPPTVETLWKRLALRGTDELDVRWRRLKTAREEILEGRSFRHFIINDNLEQAFSELSNLVIHGKNVSLTTKEGIRHCNSLLKEFERINWKSNTTPTSLLRG